MEKIALYMQCMHCLCSTKLYIYFLLWWCIVMYAILGFTIWSHIEGDPYPRNSPSDGAFISYLSYSKSPSQPGQKFGIVFLAIHTTYFVLWAVGSTVAHFTTLGARKFMNRTTRICINFWPSSNYVVTRARGKRGTKRSESEEVYHIK